mgnify:CR=1 FL=1
MANVSVKFNNKDYLLSCDDGQEESLVKLTSHLDAKYHNLKKKLGNLGENKLLLITAIKIADDYFEMPQSMAKTAEYIIDIFYKTWKENPKN